MRPRRALSYVDSLTPHLFVPSAERPVRAKMRLLAADTQVMPHSHPWAQVAISTTGVIRLTVDRGPTSCRPRARCGFRPAWNMP